MKKIIALICLTGILLLSSCGGKEEKKKICYFDYTSLPLSQYVSLSPSDYSGLSLPVDPYIEITDENVRDTVYSLSGYTDEAALAQEVIYKENDTTLQKGDLVNFYYRLSYLGKDVKGLSNYPYESTSQIRLGEGADRFLGEDNEKLFEDQLLLESIKISDYSFKTKNEGTVAANDVIEVSIEGFYYDENEKKVTLVNEVPFRMDLSDTDGEYNVLYKYIIGQNIGEDISVDTWNSSIATTVTYVIHVGFVIEEEVSYDFVMTLPENYDTSGTFSYLGGKEVTFHFIPVSVYRLTEKYLDLYKGYLESSAKSAYRDSLMSAFLTAMKEKAGEITCPEEALEAEKNDVRAYLQMGYEDYVATYGETTYPTFDDYMTAFFSKTEGLTAEEGLLKYGKSQCEEQLLVAAIAQCFGVSISETEAEAVYIQYLQYLAEQQGSTQKEIEEAYLTYYGEGYLNHYVKSSMLYEKVNEKLQSLIENGTITVVEKTGGES